jgi:UTP--glucose-1-phosphate uridylyltransferase
VEEREQPEMKRIRKAIIPAAGLGTRFLPATKAQPKEMLPIVDKPTIQYVVEEAVASGIEDIIIVTGRSKRAIEDHFDRSIELEVFLEGNNKTELLGVVQDIANLVDIHYVRQKEARGLGHAIYCARKFIGNEPFAVLLGDDIIHSEVPVLRQLMECYESNPGSIVGVQEVALDAVSKYGIVKPQHMFDRTYQALDLVEKPRQEDAPSRLAVLGRYIIEPEIFEILENIPEGSGGEIQLTDALRVLAQSGNVFAYDFEGLRYDVGDKLGFITATLEYALRREDLNQPMKDYLKSLVMNLDDRF